MEIPNCFYRVSMKGLILDETRQKFAVILEDKDNCWELPGGGLDWGENPEEGLKRELQEEMGLTITEMNPRPAYCVIGKRDVGSWGMSVVFEIKVKDLNFTPSKECREIKFISPEEVENINAYWTVKELAKVFRRNEA